MRQILSFIVLFCTACSTAMAEPLFWQAKKGQLEFIIFGSVHAGDKSMYPLPEPINDALKRSDGLILEADLKQSAGLKYPSTTITTADVLDGTVKRHSLNRSPSPSTCLINSYYSHHLGLQR